MTVTINGTSGITTPGVNSTGSNVLGDNVADTLNVGNGAIVTNSSGNVGIGTSSPAVQLHISKAGSNACRVTNTTANSYAELGRDGTGGYVEVSGVSPLQFYTNGSERMRIDSSGNLLVGTTSTFGLARATFQCANGNQALSLKTAGNSGAHTMVYFADGDSDTCGTITISATANTTAYNTSSDYRLKENVLPMTGALEKVIALNPVTWKWKHAPEVEGQGFIAHELQAVVPDAVTGEKDAVDADGNPVYQGIDTSFLVATLTKAIQEQQEQIEQLKSEVAALKGVAQ